MPDNLARSIHTEAEKPGCVIGVDVGGTKTSAGLLALPEGRVLARRLQPTAAEQGGDAVLAHVIDLVRSLQDEARRLQTTAVAVGVGVAELVDPAGRVVSEATIHWKDLAVGQRIESATSLPTKVDADVRAAARAEARLGAGRHRCSFVYVTVGTGISGCFVLGNSPYVGARGLAGTFASSTELIADDQGALVRGPPLEQFASGPALANALTALRPSFTGAAPEVLALAEAGDAQATIVVESAGRALGAAIAKLVNILDPEAVVIGGGLGLVGGLYRRALEVTLRTHIYSQCNSDLPLLSATLDADAGWIGAALFAVEG